MKYAKMLGLLAVAAAALMAFAGSASATILTDSGGNQLGVGTKIKSSAEAAAKLDGTITVTCQKSTVEGEVTSAGGSSSTPSGPISSLTFTECGSTTVEVKKAGSLEVHTDGASADGNGILTSSGAEITITTHGFLTGTTHCIYVTENTNVGTLYGSKNKSNGNATLSIDSVPIPQKETDGLCSNDAEWTGAYKVETPAYLDVD